MGDRRTAIVAAGVDVAVVLLFVVIGRRSHDEDGSWLSETATVAAPFLIALAVAWLVTRAWRTPLSPPMGIELWAVTAAGGMALRCFVFGRSTALAFVIVGSVFLLLLPAWRLVWEWAAARRQRSGPTPLPPGV